MSTNSSNKFIVTFGGWYQRTTLHLSEIYGLLALGRSRLSGLSSEKLLALRQDLDLKLVSRETASLEYVRAESGDIEIKYYEDGLYTLTIASADIKSAQTKMEKYFESRLNPAISYIFSLGAPTPKVLANIKTVHPTVVQFSPDEPADFQPHPKDFGEVYSKISTREITVLKTPDYIFVIAHPQQAALARDLVEMQIFFREFKDQLEKYLDIHRTVWEEISQIKERRSLKGKEINLVRSRLDGYQKTISLIKNRINQMGTYLHTRSSIARELKLEEHLVTLFQYKFETLADTLSYIKEIWAMTQDYLSSAIQLVVEVENQSTNNSIKSLQIITSIGVVSGIIGYLARDQFPRITLQGLVFFILLLFVTWFLNYLIAKIYSNLTYRLKINNPTVLSS